MSNRDYLTLRETRWRYILSTLERTGWDLKKASILLKVSERFLKNELKRMGGAKPGSRTPK
ncbi:MAG: hypothetical protein A4E57_03492 [Syntrophorhabdaceae bacterium PtaU1.Bin034]|jgi:lambda repressor-like predicted transcriptional regulator|nr:MAG: hypothetical protein A4E57_03492 [Syntrophorhabdaceae bacterium PtaU1.Bin034]